MKGLTVCHPYVEQPMFLITVILRALHHRRETCVATVNSTMRLMKHLFSELNIQEHQVHILSLIVSLLLYSLCKMEVLVAREELDDTEVDQAFGVCEVTMLDWIKRHSVVGGKCFGYSAQNETKLLYDSTELKVFEEYILVTRCRPLLFYK